MTFKQKTKKEKPMLPFILKRKKDEEKKLRYRATDLRFGYMKLDEEAELQYGSKFSELSDKEQRKIATKVSKHPLF